MKISFTIVNYNRKEEILLTIQKTKALPDLVNFAYEIIVVDNASSDGSADAIKAAFPDVILIQNKVNTGAPAWNLAFKKGTGDYFVILDDDSHIESGFKEAIDYLDREPTTGILALNITGGAYETGKWVDMDEMAGFIGCGAILRKSLYDKIGGYADWIFLYTNEWELGIRCLNAGFKIIYFAKCRVIHRTSQINRTTKRLIVFSVRNELAIVYKYFSTETRRRYMNRVKFNNLKGVYKYGFNALPWYLEAFREMKKLEKEIIHTPVKKETEEFYARRFWSTNAFLGIF